MVYISFPKNFVALQLPENEDKEEKTGLYRCTVENQKDYYVYLSQTVDLYSSCCISFSDTYGVTFNCCFANAFIYLLYQGVMPGYIDRLYEIIIEDIGDEAMSQKTKELNDECAAWTRQLFYEAIYNILEINEFAEIYTVWQDGSESEDDFGPPLSEKTITLDDVLTYPELFTAGDRHKLTIIKTV